MEETVLKWISTLGFPIVAFFLMHAMVNRLTKRQEKNEDDKMRLAVALHSQSTEQAEKIVSALEKSTEQSEKIIRSLDKNAVATEANTQILKKFGSDPMQICRIESVKQIIKDAGRECPSDSQIRVILDHLDKKKAKQQSPPTT